MKLEKAQRHTLKLIAIFFAVSLWFYVLNSEPVEIEKKIQISFLMPKGYTFSSLTENHLTLKLKGSKAFIGNVFTNKEKLVVDLNPYFQKFGKNFKIQYHPSQITVPFGVDILEMQPKESAIELDRVSEVLVPVRLSYIGNLPYDKKFKEVSVTPKNIMVRGPIEILKKISGVETDPINLSTLVKEEGTLNLSIEDLDSRLSIDENNIVKVIYKIQPTIPKRLQDKKE